jgi:hypothetical protein
VADTAGCSREETKEEGDPALRPSLTIPKKILSLSEASVPAGSSALPMMMPAVLSSSSSSSQQRGTIAGTGHWWLATGSKQSSNPTRAAGRPLRPLSLSLARASAPAREGSARCRVRRGVARPGRVGAPAGRVARAAADTGHRRPDRGQGQDVRARPAGGSGQWRAAVPPSRFALPALVAVLLPASIVAEVTRRPPGQEGEGRFRRRRSDVALFVFGGGRHPRVAGTRRETYWYCTVL